MKGSRYVAKATRLRNLLYHTVCTVACYGTSAKPRNYNCVEKNDDKIHRAHTQYPSLWVCAHCVGMCIAIRAAIQPTWRYALVRATLARRSSAGQLMFCTDSSPRMYQSVL